MKLFEVSDSVFLQECIDVTFLDEFLARLVEDFFEFFL